MSRVLLVTVSSLSILASQFWFSAASAVPRVDGQAASTEAVSICKSGDCDKELSELERLARKGSGDAAAVVALAYASGDGVEQDFGKAKEFIEHGVRKRNPLAMFVMADWYARGFVLPQNTEQAQLWLDRAAEKGYAPAQYDKAVKLLGSTDNAEQLQALPLLQAAAEANLVSAMYALARLQHTGTLVEQDLPAAAELYAKLARTGHTEARNHLKQVNQQLQGTELMNSAKGKSLLAAEQAMERISVTAEANRYRSQLGRLIDQIDASGSYDNRSIGSRINGVGCGDTGSPCGISKPSRGQGSLNDVLTGGQGNN
ncbi:MULTISPECIES: tetratricopeptide repeat protein [Idiomarina]|uniref:tetratricopeptide repeat protein n=1 Tax=Idiomarina TaxID=135575 RepID=UPI00129B29A4|nr:MULTISPECIES: tetratricopeptide repeat protein [Idiomarina]MRJ41619.1 sel1 repeat family protein [Idiomarina sp. FeN1]NCU57609.1 sel1 repeat family protein [Idiomarina sp. FenA--70]NCU60161.1 sel1 repeat family protein [Idiomarina sp. FenBw--71]UUN13748.1 sel1 repeat family protein [Idiomarina loihiensis]